MSIGIIVFAHGSRIESANDGVRTLAAALARAGSFPYVEPAFLELGKPDLAGAVDMLAARGVDRIVIIPYFLTLGIHLERDLPQLVNALMESHPGIAIRTTPPLEGHPGLVQLLLDRCAEAL